jgi:hypothetical protein
MRLVVAGEAFQGFHPLREHDPLIMLNMIPERIRGYSARKRPDPMPSRMTVRIASGNSSLWQYDAIFELRRWCAPWFHWIVMKGEKGPFPAFHAEIVSDNIPYFSRPGPAASPPPHTENTVSRVLQDIVADRKNEIFLVPDIAVNRLFGVAESVRDRLGGRILVPAFDKDIERRVLDLPLLAFIPYFFQFNLG